MRMNGSVCTALIQLDENTDLGKGQTSTCSLRTTICSIFCVFWLTRSIRVRGVSFEFFHQNQTLIYPNKTRICLILYD